MDQEQEVIDDEIHGFKCPHCGELIPKIKRLCPRNISFTDSKKGTMRRFDKKRSIGTTSLFDHIYNWLQEKTINTQIIKHDILKDLNLEDKTSGDDVNQCLNFFICLGAVERYEHNVSVEGKESSHKYKLLDMNNHISCPYYSRDNKKELFRCKCPEEEFKMVVL